MESSQTERYTFHEVVGEGSCGRVYRCTSPDGESRAVKVLTAMAINRDLVRYSLRKLDELPEHPGIAKVYSASLSDTPYHYVTDLFADPVLDEKGDEAWKSRRLDRVIGKISRDEAWRIIDQIGEGLSFLHENDLFHGCLKPSNVFLASADAGAEVKLADPGQGWVSGAHYLELHDIPFYASPEQLQTAEFLDSYGKRWDVYSFGVVAFLLLNGRLPRLFELFTERRRSGASWDSPNDEDLVVEPYDQPPHEPHEYAVLLEAAPEITWDFVPADESEERRVAILIRCLSLEVEERYEDMLAVVGSFRKERLATEVEGIEGLAMGWKERVRKLFQNIGKHAAVLVAFLFLAVGAIILQQILLFNSQRKVAAAEEVQAQLLEDKDEEIKQAENRVLAAAEEVAAAAELAATVRAQLRDGRDFADVMFGIMNRSRSADSEAFQKNRLEVLKIARTHYSSFIAKNGSNPGLVEETVGARGNLVSILREIGSRKETLAALGDYSKSVHQALEENPDDRLWLSRKAAVHREAAEIYLELRSLDEASKEADAAVGLFEELAEVGDVETNGVASAGDEGVLNLASGLSVRADVQMARKDLKGATKTLTRNVEMLMPLYDAAPTDPRFRYRLAGDFSRLGDIFHVQRDIDPALKSFGEAEAMLAKLIKDDGPNDEYIHQLAHCLVIRGEIHSDMDAAQKALNILKELVKRNIGNEKYLHTLARCYGALSELQRDGGQPKNAVALQMSARDILGDLVRENPSVQDYRFDFAGCLARLAGLEEDAGHFKESLAFLNGAVLEVEKLSVVSPDSIQYQRSLAELRGNIGFANEKVGNKEKAKELYASAVDQWERLASLMPEDDLVERGLLWSRRQLAALDR